ncbi:hypothetical protein C5167_034535 [Papaver somniferum]|uniref:Uncharacterized protein n=1 Tax=Papaver somniferum TaxID=3469 RepID=A0A4Y7KES6_PAPSO|nr:hypothetical protein C5167_034535 [Papaver somniferum]
MASLCPAILRACTPHASVNQLDAAKFLKITKEITKYGTSEWKDMHSNIHGLNSSCADAFCMDLRAQQQLQKGILVFLQHHKGILVSVSFMYSGFLDYIENAPINQSVDVLHRFKKPVQMRSHKFKRNCASLLLDEY